MTTEKRARELRVFSLGRLVLLSEFKSIQVGKRGLEAGEGQGKGRRRSRMEVPARLKDCRS